MNWHELATKADVEALRQEMREQMASKADLRVLAAELRSEMHQGFAAQTRWLVGANTALAALSITVARLLF